MVEPTITYLGLGGNLGDRMQALAEALELLDRTPGLLRVSCSAVYETEPWGVAEQPHFLNLVAGYETTLPPADLLDACKAVERNVGREQSYRWGPRLIDVDVLLYGDQQVNITDPHLEIPHPRLAERAFVLVPLAELAPDAVVPPGNAPVRRLLSVVSGKDGVARWGVAPVS